MKGYELVFIIFVVGCLKKIIEAGENGKGN